jgi:hypothetical protein
MRFAMRDLAVEFSHNSARCIRKQKWEESVNETGKHSINQLAYNGNGEPHVLEVVQSYFIRVFGKCVHSSILSIV